MASRPVTLDMSTAQPLPAPVTLDMSTAQPLDQQSQQLPSFLQRLTAGYNPGAQNLSAPLRFLDAAGGAMLGLPANLYHAVADPLTPQEKQEFKGHTQIPGEVALERLSGAPLVRGAETYANPQTRPTLQQAASVLPEALGTGVGNVAGAEVTAQGFNAARSAVAPVVRGAAEKMYAKALKPSTNTAPAKAQSMVQTGLEQGIPVSASGVDKLGGLIDDLNDQISDTIQSDPTRPINKFAVTSRLADTAKRFQTQVNPESDLNAVSESGNEFLRNQPGEIPAEQAQALKTGTYKQLQNRSYGELKSPQIEAQKALARGLKEELNNAFPELQNLNAQESALLNLSPVLERAVQRQSNNQFIGIGGPLMAGATKAVTGSNKLAAVAGFMKAIVDRPDVKSNLAIALQRAGVPRSAAAARIQAYSSALGASTAATDDDHEFLNNPAAWNAAGQL